MKKDSAVEWLHYVSKQRELDKFDWEQAKAMEKEQAHKYAEFAIRCDRKDMKILNFDGYINFKNTEQ
jgi:hypothetical protein